MINAVNKLTCTRAFRMLRLCLDVNSRRRHQYGVARFDHEEFDWNLAHGQVADDLLGEWRVIQSV